MRRKCDSLTSKLFPAQRAGNQRSCYQGGGPALDQPDARGPVYKDPEEACPYRRPFEPGFSGCPAYVPIVFTPEDLRGRPLQPVRGCAHTQVGRRRGERNRYFTACALGTAEDRQRWAERAS